MSEQKLMVYGLMLLTLIVAAILSIAVMFPDESRSASTEDSQKEITGLSVLKSTPLIDGSNGLVAKIYTMNKGVVNSFPFDLDLRAVKDESIKYKWCQTDLPRLKEGAVSSQVWTIQTPCVSQYKDAVAKTLQQIDIITRLVNKYPKDMKWIYAADGINETFTEQKIGNMIGINGGHSIDNKLAILRTYYNLGVRILRLTSGCSTVCSERLASQKICRIVYSGKFDDRDEIESKLLNNEKSQYYGQILKDKPPLSDFGKVIIKEMNWLGIIIDLSDSSYETQKAVLDTTQAPVIYSSSGVYSISTHEANIRDDILLKVKENGGLIMMTFNQEYLAISDKKEKVTINNIIAHINHIKEIIGADHIGIGSSYNNIDSSIEGMEDSSKYPHLFDLLIESKTWEQEDLKKIAGLNFYRVFRAAEQVKDKLSKESEANEIYIPEQDIAKSDLTCYTMP